MSRKETEARLRYALVLDCVKRGASESVLIRRFGVSKEFARAAVAEAALAPADPYDEYIERDISCCKAAIKQCDFIIDAYRSELEKHIRCGNPSEASAAAGRLATEQSKRDAIARAHDVQVYMEATPR